MPELAIGGAISALKTAGEIAGSFVKLRDQALIQGKVIELQSVILAAQGSALAAQGEQFTLLEEKRALEKEIADVKAWDAEKQKYELIQVAGGVFAYSLKSDISNTEPYHRICANCYENGHKSILQRKYQDVGRRAFLCCSACKADILVEGAGVHYLSPPVRVSESSPQIKKDYDPLGPDAV